MMNAAGEPTARHPERIVAVPVEEQVRVRRFELPVDTGNLATEKSRLERFSRLLETAFERQWSIADRLQLKEVVRALQARVDELDMMEERIMADVLEEMSGVLGSLVITTKEKERIVERTVQERMKSMQIEGMAVETPQFGRREKRDRGFDDVEQRRREVIHEQIEMDQERKRRAYESVPAFPYYPNYGFALGKQRVKKYRKGFKPE